MMRVAVYGARDGALIKKQISYHPEMDIDVAFLVDSNETLWGTAREYSEGMHISVVSPEEMKSRYEQKEIDAVVVAVRSADNRWFLTEKLKQMGIENIGLIYPGMLTYGWDFDAEGAPGFKNQIVWLKDIKKPLIYGVEIHGEDACNLNCKGCLHFSGLFERSTCESIEKTVEDVRFLSTKCEIFNLRVLGGEPLLNRHLDDMLLKLRENLPNTDIAVVTNGTLITRQPENLFRVMREKKIGFHITLYPPTHSQKDEIYRFLDERGISYGSHLAKKDEFFKGLMQTPSEGESCSHLVCIPKNSFLLREGKLYKCSPDGTIYKFYEKFGISSLCNDSGINIYDADIDWEKAIAKIYNSPIEMCKYCSEHLIGFEWGVANPPRVDDWFIQ